jgi:hypothetical protein
MPKPLSPETIAIIKSTAPALRQHGLAITTRMYERLFVDPDIKAMFDEAAHKSGEQPKLRAMLRSRSSRNIILRSPTPFFRRSRMCLARPWTRRCSAPGAKPIGSSPTS